jgi:hypothetical protein
MSYEGAGEVEYETTGDLNESLYYERLSVDQEQAMLEAEGNRHYLRLRKVAKFLEEGEVEQAVLVCPHGHVGGLDGSCTDDDPRHGEEGYRCFECGGHVAEIGGPVLHLR